VKKFIRELREWPRILFRFSIRADGRNYQIEIPKA